MGIGIAGLGIDYTLLVRCLLACWLLTDCFLTYLPFGTGFLVVDSRYQMVNTTNVGID